MRGIQPSNGPGLGSTFDNSCDAFRRIFPQQLVSIVDVVLLCKCLAFSCRSVPVYLEWIKYLSWFLYSNELLVVNQWKDVEITDCDLGAVLNGTAAPCFPSGNEVIKKYGFDEVRYFFVLYWNVAISTFSGQLGF